MAVIDQSPRGLISIFGLRDMGAVPKELSEQVVGTFDISELCLLNRELLVGTFSTGGVGSFSQVTVPPGELWYVWSFSLVTGILGAGESLRMTPGYVAGGAAANILAAGLPRTATAGELAAAFVDRAIWLGPGSGLGMLVEAEVGPVKTVNWRAVIVRLRV